MTDARNLLTVANAEVGYSRWTDPERGTKYGRWYELRVDRCSTNYDFGANGVPYCAMFVSWCLVQAGISCAGFPSAYCPSIHHYQTLSPGNLVPGDIVLFDWELDGTDDHVGIVEWNDGTYIGTIEGNTNNGCVARRVRSYATICGGIRPNYDEFAPSKPTEVITAERIDEDGWWGAQTTLKAQEVFGTERSGFIRAQYDPTLKRINKGGLLPSTWLTGSGGDETVENLQKMIGAQADGYFGRETCRAMQRYFGTPVDGEIWAPSAVIKAFQRWLNRA